MPEKKVWVKAAGKKAWDERKTRVTDALESGADGVWVNKEDFENTQKLGKIKVISDHPEADVVLGENAIYQVIFSKQEEQQATKLGAKAEYLIINSTDWKVIPLENIIASLQNKCKVIVEVKTLQEAKTALETLELGADGVLVDEDHVVIKKVCEYVKQLSQEKIGLVPVTIKKIKPVGMGDRVCVDTASLFNLGEGMLVGSQSNALFLVHAETLETEYVAARPFRVNAGPVHAYTRMPDGKTKYLSELTSGEDILAVDKNGESRSLVVGRLKIERRPLMLVEAEYEGRTVKTLLQNAETILLVREGGDAASISKLGEGDKVLAYIEDVGRHFGMRVEETINEK